MNIIISNSSGVPIYEQIYEAIKNQIICNDLKDGEALPSIRSLASNLRVSVITTKRAYEELERDGYIHTLKGKGSFVAPQNIELIRETKLKEIEDKILEILTISSSINLSKDELIEMINILSE